MWLAVSLAVSPARGEDEAAVLKNRIAELERRVAELEGVQAGRPMPADEDSPYGWRDPFREIERMREEMFRVFDEDMMIPRSGLRMPGLTAEMLFDDQFEIRDEGDTYLILSDIPDMAEDSLKVEARGQMLVISGEREEDKKEEGPGMIRRQRFFGTFSRSLPLPVDADASALDVSYDDDVLTVRLKKKEKKQP
jgi:HSP20 family protein